MKPKNTFLARIFSVVFLFIGVIVFIFIKDKMSGVYFILISNSLLIAICVAEIDNITKKFKK